jgi:tRNA threonylcarbamoyladenosine biosynthesis protein TsaE
LSVVTSLELTSHSVEQTVDLGVRLGQLLDSGDVICLSGDLGAGKTALTTGIGKGWGAREPVNSPTFVFVHEHRRPTDALRLYHVDCYRLGSLDDADTIGIEDILAGNDVVVIEWPERIETLLPAERLWISLDILDATTAAISERRITLQATGPRYAALLHDLRAE